MNDQNAKPMQKFKRILGLSLFWLSGLLWLAPLALPFVLDADTATISTVSISLLVVAEIIFAASLLLLGRPFYQAMKQRSKAIWRKLIRSN